MKFVDTCSLIKWQSMWICLALSWVIGLFAIRMVEVLSHNTLHEGTLMSKALRSCLSHNNSDVTKAKALYSDSTADLDIVTSFLDYQDTNDSSMKIQKPVVDFLVVIQLPQYASECVEMWSEGFDENNIPWPDVPFKYCKLWLTLKHVLSFMDKFRAITSKDYVIYIYQKDNKRTTRSFCK